MAKLEVSDDQLKKFMDEATTAHVKELEKEIASLERKLRRAKLNEAAAKEQAAVSEYAVEVVHNIIAAVKHVDFGYDDD